MGLSTLALLVVGLMAPNFVGNGPDQLPEAGVAAFEYRAPDSIVGSTAVVADQRHDSTTTSLLTSSDDESSSTVEDPTLALLAAEDSARVTTTLSDAATPSTEKEKEKKSSPSRSTTTTTTEHHKPSNSTTTTVAAPVTTSPPPSGNQTGSGQITISGKSGVVIENMSISNPGGDCVRVNGSSNVTIRNSTIGPCGGKAVVISNSSGVTVDQVSFTNVGTGVYALSSQAIVVSNSTFIHAGRNFVQFDKVTGSGNRISGNSGYNSLGGSNAEDLISVYKSGGTSGSPLRVSGNHLSNGGPSQSGSGIMVGDAGGTYTVVEGNTLVNPGQVGIGVAGGSHIRVLSNNVSSDALPWSNVGIYVWNQAGGSCSAMEVSGNTVNWKSASGANNAAWDGGNCGSIAGWGSNSW